MEENTPAVECMILFYINTKHILKTKQLDERVFLDQMTRHCKESGFHSYNNEDIRNTWKDLVSKYLELKANGTVEDKEAWKYYEILDSCYEQSDFHNGVYPKFSEEMVWFLIECFLKRRGLEKTMKRNNILNEIHKEFLQYGYLYITKQDIDNKWKYLNAKYDKVKDDPEALNKLPYLQAVAKFREKRDTYVKMIFTKDLTEILIERFTEKKITCVIHGYDSEQVLGEIRYEFRELGFDFSQQDIKEKWRKLSNVYWFLKAKGKHDSSWIYFNAMMDHFKDNYLLEFQKRGKNIHRNVNYRKPSLRQRSKSVGADVRTKQTIDAIKTNLVVNIEPLDEKKLPPSPKRKLMVEKPLNKRKLSVKRSNEENTKDSLKKIRTRSKSREKSKMKEDIVENSKGITTIDTNDNNKVPQSANQAKDSISVKKSTQLTRLCMDRNFNRERKSSTDLGSPGSKVHIINIDHSDIDKKSGNLTINLPSITKQFSDNEFLPLKKRLRLGEGHTDKHSDDTREVEDDFLGFPALDIYDGKGLKPETECKRLTEEEMAEILKSINEDSSEKSSLPNNINKQDPTNCKPEDINYNYMGPYSSFNQPCLIIPKEEQPDNLSLQTYNNPSALTPPPVLLLVIKVDGANNSLRESTTSDVSKDNDKEKHELVEKGEPKQSNNVLNIAANTGDHSGEFIKPASPKSNSINFMEVLNANEVPDASEEIVYEIQSEYNNLDENAEHNSKNVSNEIIAFECPKYKKEEMDDVQTPSVPRNTPSATNKEVNLNENMAIHDNEINKTRKTREDVNTEKVISYNKAPAVNNTDIPKLVESVPATRDEKNAVVPQQQPNPKSIRLPVKGGGKVKEIYISPQELNKIARMRPEDFKIKPNLVKSVKDEVIKTATEPVISPAKKISKFVSHTIKPPFTEKQAENKPEKIVHKTRNKVNSAADHKDVIAPPPLFISTNKFVGTNNCNGGSRTSKNEEFDSESVFSEAVGDDDLVKDNLLATVVDFQEQNSQEFVEIKNLMKQNNLLQRETNRLLRLMLEKM